MRKMITSEPASTAASTAAYNERRSRYWSAKRARIFLDAYPGEAFDATLLSASPVATAGLDSPVRNFLAKRLAATKRGGNSIAGNIVFRRAEAAADNYDSGAPQRRSARVLNGELLFNFH